MILGKLLCAYMQHTQAETCVLLEPDGNSVARLSSSLFYAKAYMYTASLVFAEWADKGRPGATRIGRHLEGHNHLVWNMAFLKPCP